MPNPWHLQKHLKNDTEKENGKRKKENSINFYVKLNPKITENFPTDAFLFNFTWSCHRLMTIERDLIMLVGFSIFNEQEDRDGNIFLFASHLLTIYPWETFLHCLLTNFQRTQIELKTLWNLCRNTFESKLWLAWVEA